MALEVLVEALQQQKNAAGKLLEAQQVQAQPALALQQHLQQSPDGKESALLVHRVFFTILILLAGAGSR